jgi:YVTN family beta-propeller protein
MVDLPTGTVTFLFTDIEGSTRLLKQLGPRYGDVLAEQQRIIRAAAEERGGREIDTQGDSFFFAFSRANAALGAAVVAQHGLAAHEWPDGVSVRVRMGLHTGEPVVGEQRYIGLGVHRAARIGAVAHGGQVLLSNATRELVDDEVGGVAIRELGTYRLKDIDRPERLYQLDIEGLESEFPPLKAEKVAEPHRVSRRTLLAAALAAVLAAAVAIPIFAFGQGGGGKGSVEAAAGNSVAFVDPSSGRLTNDVEVGTAPADVVFGDGAVWTTNSGDGTVDRIDPASGTIRQTIRVGDGPTAIVFGAGSIWAANAASGTVSRIDPGSNNLTQTIGVGNGPSGIAFGRGDVWVVNRDDYTLSRIDAATGDVVRTFTVGGGLVDVAVGAGGVWVASQSEDKVLRIDPRSGRVLDSANVGRGPAAIAATEHDVWVANSLDGTVSRIDPETSSVTAVIRVGTSPSGIAVEGDSVWVSLQFDGSIAHIDPATNQVARTVSVGGNPTGLAIGTDRVFVAVRPARGAHRGGTLTMVETPGFEDFYRTIDPAVFLNLRMSVAYDGLTGFTRVGGQEGTQVVPDLATNLPVPADAGKTYTFRIRRGIRYSTGRRLRTADFRRGLERVFEVGNGDGAFLFASIVGAKACSQRPKRCDLSEGIVADENAGTVTFHLTEPDPNFLAKLATGFAVAVPSDTPTRLSRARPLPATGPYQIVGHSSRQVRLVRNPYFREWSRAAKPDGYPDEIVIRLNVPIAERLRAIGRGDADISDLTFDRALDIPRLRARYGSLLHSTPEPLVHYTFLNTNVPPFDDVRVRRALNYAVDREAIVRAAGGADRASASCQILPANYPGYRPYCPYEHNFAQARRLVASSGTRGTPVTVWTRTSYKRFFALVVETLETLGYPARLKLVDDVMYYDALQRADPATVQAGYIGWGTVYPSTMEYFVSFLDFLKPRARLVSAFEPQIQHAVKLQQTDPATANEVWAQVDRALVDSALVVPLYNNRIVFLVSKRLGNYQSHPFWDVLLDQMWVR